MFIIGCDFHSHFQQIATLNPITGEILKRRLEHENGEAKKFYADLPSPARVGMEATFNAQWFERMLQEHSHEHWTKLALRNGTSSPIGSWTPARCC
jgi:hypothetical protein